MKKNKKKLKRGPKRVENLTEKLRFVNFKFALDDLAKKHDIKHFIARFETENQATGHSSVSPLAQLLGMVKIIEIDLTNNYLGQTKDKK